MESEIDDMSLFVTIRVFAVHVERLFSSCQTDHTSFISINESHLEALGVVWGILLQVRDYKRRTEVQSYPGRFLTCRRPYFTESYSLEWRIQCAGVSQRSQDIDQDLPALN